MGKKHSGLEKRQVQTCPIFLTTNERGFKLNSAYLCCSDDGSRSSSQNDKLRG